MYFMRGIGFIGTGRAFKTVGLAPPTAFGLIGSDFFLHASGRGIGLIGIRGISMALVSLSADVSR